MTNVALGIISHNNFAQMSSNLPVIKDCFDGVIVVDAESTDGTDKFCQENGAIVVSRPWNDNYADARNAVIKEAEARGYDWLFMLDTDECMFPKHIENIKKYMFGERTFFILPRIEFTKDNQHFNPSLYPDRQGRIFKLNMGYHYRNKIHELLYRGDDEKSCFEMNYGLMLPQFPIYHYGRCILPKDMWLKYHNYDRIMRGEEPLKEIPADFDATHYLDEKKIWEGMEEFYGAQPI